MNKIFFTKRTSILLLAISLFSSCMEKDVYQGDKNTPLNPRGIRFQSDERSKTERRLWFHQRLLHYFRALQSESHEGREQLLDKR